MDNRKDTKDTAYIQPGPGSVAKGASLAYWERIAGE
jgi:hypothetical protein